MKTLSGRRVALLATDGVEESELLVSRRALREAGAEVDVIAPHAGPIQSFHGQDKASRIEVDRVLGSETLHPAQYDALLLPGGPLSADALRNHPPALGFARHFDETERPIAAICHAPWVLISAGVASGRRLTSFPSLRDDLANAGAAWMNEAVVVDENLVTSRTPEDLPAFVREMLELFARGVPLISPEARHILARSRIA